MYRQDHSFNEYDAGTAERDRLDNLIVAGLSHGAEISDMCRTFRELWAISNRNADIHDYLMDYYREFASIVVESIFDDRIDALNKHKVASLLIPFFEGYSVTAQSLKLDAEEIAKMTTNLAIQIAHSESVK